MRSDAIKNYMFLGDSQQVEVVEMQYGEVVMNCKFLYITYRCKIEQTNTLQHNDIMG